MDSYGTPIRNGARRGRRGSTRGQHGYGSALFTVDALLKATCAEMRCTYTARRAPATEAARRRRHKRPSLQTPPTPLTRAIAGEDTTAAEQAEASAGSSEVSEGKVAVDRAGERGGEGGLRRPTPLKQRRASDGGGKSDPLSGDGEVVTATDFFREEVRVQLADLQRQMASLTTTVDKIFDMQKEADNF